jgi:polyphosphate kinase
MNEQGASDSLLNREISWLHFNHRVLQEASDPSVPLLARLSFCGIFSSNLDEYFRVRVASLRTLLRLGQPDAEQMGTEPGRLLHDIHRLVLEQQETYGGVIAELMDEFAREGIRRLDETEVSPEHHEFLRSYFDSAVAPHLEPIVLSEAGAPPFLDNRAIYLAVELWSAPGEGSWSPQYALIKVPEEVPRFLRLPDADEHRYMFLDDAIRFNLPRVFPEHEVGRAYAVKLTRDADLNLDDEFEGSVADAIRESLGQRHLGAPSRFLYDMRAPYQLVHFLRQRLDLAEEDMVQGGRYHNLHEYPRFDRDDLASPEWPAVPHPVLDRAPSVFEAVREGDQVLHMPYQSFDHVVEFLDEAARDPAVQEIWLTVYRVARDSSVLQALIRGAEAGKRVTVFMEVQARFDEESNLEWAKRLEAAGVRTLYSMRGLKVHAKIALVVRQEDEGLRRYAYVGTGNFNEKTAVIYADHGVLTCDERITADVEEVFRYLAGEVAEPQTKHLLVAPFSLRNGFNGLIEHEQSRAAAGEPSGMILKMNSLQDPDMISRLYQASRAGVPIDLIVRGICCLIPGVAGQSETVRVRSIVDRLLEHARIYLFHHDGEERMYLASADWMTRNLSRRVEVAIPIYDPEVKRQLRQCIDIQLADNVKARELDASGKNAYVSRQNGETPVRAQRAFREIVKDLGCGQGGI